MKTILYATDYSKNSVVALKYAQNLSNTMDFRLVVTHVFGYRIVAESVVLDELPELRKNALKANRVRLEEFCTEHLGKDRKKMDLQIVQNAKASIDTFNDNRKKMDLQIVPAENMSIVDGIIGVANEWHAQMIVVGTKGESALKEIIMGNTTKQLIKKAPCPIMAIPTDANYKPFKTIVYATDLEEEDVYAICKLTELAKAFDAKIKVVHIITEDEYEGEAQMEWFKEMLEAKVSYDKMEFKLFFSGDIFESLRIYLDDVNADMVVMLEREHKGIFKKWFRRDLVKKMESYGRVPLMSFREGNHQLFYFSAVL